MKPQGLKPMAIKNEQDKYYNDYINSRSTFAKEFNPWERGGLLPNQTGPISKSSIHNDFIFTAAVGPRLTDPVPPCNLGPSNRWILIALGMVLGCGLTLLFELIFGV